jgi:hypothetical protein
LDSAPVQKLCKPKFSAVFAIFNRNSLIWNYFYAQRDEFLAGRNDFSARENEFSVRQREVSAP